MILEKLSLINFKNCQEATISFCEKINCLLGDNGEGKTNILDAIYYLSFCKSYFNPVDSQNIRTGENFFVIQGVYTHDGDESEVYCAQKRSQKKIFKRNKKEYSRLSDHIGLYPLVMISPSDSDLINEGSDIRRKFIDSIISQYDQNYLNVLIGYNKALMQRNALLKQFASSGSYSPDLLSVWDFKLAEAAEVIFKARTAFLEGFKDRFAGYFRAISGGKETAGLQYRSDLQEGSFEEKLKNSLHRDRATEYTQVGIHKDELIFTLNNAPVKKFGSQGQQKSFLIALKLAQYEYISFIKRVKPILLLDDIFDKLDDKRVTRLLEMVMSDDFGQVFITDTSQEKLPAIIGKSSIPQFYFLVAEGMVSKA